MTIVFVEATAEAVSVARWLCENGIMASANKTKVLYATEFVFFFIVDYSV